jgi:energy-coupling factor transport system ATP-binding protein
LGTNGCGKSTLAKHFNSVLLPSGGKVWVCGLDTSNEDKLTAIRRNVGMVFQNPDNQIVANVVEEDVAFGPENLGVASPEIRRRVDQALKQVDMYEYREHAPHLLSGGQKQRVAIAGVIAMEPEILILDEPASGLDPGGRREILGGVKKYARESGTNVIIVSHLSKATYGSICLNNTMTLFVCLLQQSLLRQASPGSIDGGTRMVVCLLLSLVCSHC